MTAFHDLIDTSGLAPDEEVRLHRVHELLVRAGPPPDLPPALATPPLQTSDATILQFPLLPRRRFAFAAVAAATLALIVFAGGDALRIYRVFFGYLYGHILTEQEVVERPEENDDVLRLGLHRLAITEFPQVRTLAFALATHDGAAELDHALDLLLIGLTATMSAPDGSPSST